MFAFDIFKQDDRRLQVIAWVVACGMLLLLGGLWMVQIVHAKQFQTELKKQSFRHVRTPAIRGKIRDRNGLVLADEKPRYNAILYLEDLQHQFDEQYSWLRTNYGRAHPEVVNAKGKISLPKNVGQQLRLDADCAVVSNITYCVSTSLEEPRALDIKAFLRHYNDQPYVPFQIVSDLAPKQVAIFAEQWSGQTGIDLETQPVRVYPYHSLAANLLGYVQRRNLPGDGQFSFDMPDYQGTSGVEYVYNEKLSGQPGDNSVLINILNYRQREEVETPILPGNDIYLTIDLPLQRAAEQALARAPGAGPTVRGAVVVMDSRNGDILALASAPSFDPNIFALGHMTHEEMERLNDPKYTPQINRAVGGAYPPGSTFKIITAIACLESGLDPNEVFDSPGEYRPTRAARAIGDTAGAGKFNFERAFYRSSNTYFIVKGLKAGLRKILEVAQRFHLGEETGLSTRQEVAGNIPGPEQAGSSLGISAPDVCIGQEITATPLQMAGMISVMANGGTLYIPRVVSHDCSETGETEELAAPGRVRDHVQINPRDLDIIRRAMLADTEHPPDSMGEGSAYKAFHNGSAPKLGNFRVAGKTGTAEVKSPGSPYRRVTWFDSYGPYEDPRYVVVVMVEDGAFGGPTCAPVAEEIYAAIVKREQQSGAGHAAPLARN
jgi:penicillin-binding protein 2